MPGRRDGPSSERGWLENSTLADGTGLALQFGHRHSDDVSLLRVEPFDPLPLAESPGAVGRFRVQQAAANALHLERSGLRVSFLGAERPFLFEGIPYLGLTVADPRDITVMKVMAIGGRGGRRDFVDLFVYLETGETLEEILSLLQERSHASDCARYHLLKSLVYFEDAEQERMPRMILPVEWNSVEELLIAEVRRLSLA